MQCGAIIYHNSLLCLTLTRQQETIKEPLVINFGVFFMSVFDFGEFGCKLPEELIASVIYFHGHSCVGLSFGIRIGEWVVNEFGRSSDEEIVAVVETDMCSVDAIQFLVGCTFGKGNLIFHDYGKNVYSFFRRSDGKNARIATQLNNQKFSNDKSGGLLADLKEQQRKLAPNDTEGNTHINNLMIDRVMRTDFDKLFSVTPARMPIPDKARIYKSIPCFQCNELVMETRITKDQHGNYLCKECLTKSNSK
jgi:formylmethanofuran dehydrogenase subunit E